MDYETYRAARERLKVVELEPQEYERYETYVRKDKLTVYDCEHDATQATVEWLETLPADRVRFDTVLGVLTIGVLTYQGWMAVPKQNHTRGDVLTLLRVLGEGK